jgi:hypothetical protein
MKAPIGPGQTFSLCTSSVNVSLAYPLCSMAGWSFVVGLSADRSLFPPHLTPVFDDMEVRCDRCTTAIGLITHCSLVLLGRPKNKESVVVASDITDSPHGGPESPFEARIHPVNSYRGMTSRRTTDTLGTRHTQFECCTKQLVALNSPIFPVGNLTQDPALILDSPRHTGGPI